MIKRIVNSVRFYLMPVSSILKFSLPYFMMWVFTKNSEWYIYLIPVFVWIAAGCLQMLANKKGRGNEIPVPADRFTEVSDDGEISVNSNRLQEMLVYMADLEDWMERKGIAK